MMYLPLFLHLLNHHLQGLHQVVLELNFLEWKAYIYQTCGISGTIWWSADYYTRNTKQPISYTRSGLPRVHTGKSLKCSQHSYSQIYDSLSRKLDNLNLPNIPPGPCWGLGAGRLKKSCPIRSRYSRYDGSLFKLVWYCSHKTVKYVTFPLEIQENVKVISFTVLPFS